MPTEREINEFIAKQNKASIVLELLLKNDYVTGSDIINYNCEDTPLVFTTCPHKLIEIIRKRFGYDFVQDREVTFYRDKKKPNGATYKVSDTYKQYFLKKVSA